MKAGEKDKFNTFIVFSHDSSGKTVSFRVPSFILRYSVLFIIVCFSIFSLSIFYSVFLSGKLIHYGVLAHRGAENIKKVDNLLVEKDNIQTELQAILDQNNELRRVLGLRIKKIKINVGNKDDGKKQPFGMNFKLHKISSMLKISLKETNEGKISVQELAARVLEIQSRLASTPSTWPIHGRIMSYYGFRSFPWRGRHTGIDIHAKFGAPVCATAPGVVRYAGWRNGYGKTVEIDHGYGFKTLYGHNSQNIVFAGERVVKGQVVALVGMTGFTTGPHLHYEVQRHDIPINPLAFLDIDILSAGRYF